MAKLIFVTGEEGDWEGVYVAGKLVQEGHEITKYDLLDCLKEYECDIVDDYETYTINQEYLEEFGMSLYFEKIDKTMLTKN